jgi:uncharacterized protein (TIGR03437 family)
LQPGFGVVTLTTSSGAILQFGAELLWVAPGLFTADGSGQGLAAAQVVSVHQGKQTFMPAVAKCSAGTCQPIPIKIGSAEGDETVLILYGTGFAETLGPQLGIPTSVLVNGPTIDRSPISLVVDYVGGQGYYPGLDQVNVQLPSSLSSLGLVYLTLMVPGDDPFYTVNSNVVTIDIE